MTLIVCVTLSRVAALVCSERYVKTAMTMTATTASPNPSSGPGGRGSRERRKSDPDVGSVMCALYSRRHAGADSIFEDAIEPSRLRLGGTSGRGAQESFLTRPRDGGRSLERVGAGLHRAEEVAERAADLQRLRQALQVQARVPEVIASRTHDAARIHH